MKSEIAVARALGAVFVQRMLGLFTVVGLTVSALLLLIVWALATWLSSWWWLLLIIILPLIAIFLFVRLVASFIAKRIYPQRINKSQKASLGGFVDTVQGLLEARVMGWPLFVLISVKDLVLHRELRSLKKLISDTAGLRQEFNNLKNDLVATDSNG